MGVFRTIFGLFLIAAFLFMMVIIIGMFIYHPIEMAIALGIFLWITLLIVRKHNRTNRAEKKYTN